MESMLLNGIYYAVEFIKVWLAANGLFRLKMKRTLYHWFSLSLIAIMVVSPWYSIWKSDPIFYIVLIYVIFFVSLQDKKNMGWVIFIHIAITLVDMLISCVVMLVYPFSGEQMLEYPVFVILINAIAMVLLIILVCCIHKKRKEKSLMLVYSDALIFIVCAIALVIMIAPMQLNMLGDHYSLGILSTGLAAAVIAISLFLLRYKKQRELVRLENDMVQSLMKAQEVYYTTLLQKEEETKAFRHDIKEHLLCIQTLNREKRYEELDTYLSQMNQNIREISPRFITGNAYINLILSDLSSQFEDVNVDWIGKVPELSLETMDICSLFYNLLKNAFEAAHRVDDKTVHVIIKLQESNLLVVIINSYHDVDFEEGYGYRTIKEEKGHGYGICNIRRCVKKYHGDYSVDAADGIFCTEITLPDVILK